MSPFYSTNACSSIGYFILVERIRKNIALQANIKSINIVLLTYRI